MLNDHFKSISYFFAMHASNNFLGIPSIFSLVCYHLKCSDYAQKKSGKCKWGFLWSQRFMPFSMNNLVMECWFQDFHNPFQISAECTSYLTFHTLNRITTISFTLQSYFA